MSLCNLEHGISRIKIFLLGTNFSSFKRVEIEWMEREKVLRTIEKEQGRKARGRFHLIKNVATIFAPVFSRVLFVLLKPWNYLSPLQPPYFRGRFHASRLTRRATPRRIVCLHNGTRRVLRTSSFPNAWDEREREKTRNSCEITKMKKRKDGVGYGAWKVMESRVSSSRVRNGRAKCKVRGGERKGGWRREKEEEEEERVRGSRCKGETSSVVDSLRFIFASESVPCPLPYSVFQNRLTLSRSWLG